MIDRKAKNNKVFGRQLLRWFFSQNMVKEGLHKRYIPGDLDKTLIFRNRSRFSSSRKIGDILQEQNSSENMVA